MKIVSWNVNGIRACVRKGAFFSYLETHAPDILFLQETKATVHDLDESILNPSGYYGVWHSAERKGYSGVALITRVKPKLVLEGFGNDRFDNEGRVIVAEYDDFYVLGCYFPNGQKDDERLAYKLDFYKAVFDYCEELKADGKPVIVCGDYNTAHTEIDLARPKENQTVSGFLPIERDWMDKVIDDYGYVDTFRHFYPDTKEAYSWWTFRANARKRNVGWRIDYVLVSNDGVSMLDDAFINADVMGSDHCPVGVTLKNS